MVTTAGGLSGLSGQVPRPQGQGGIADVRRSPASDHHGLLSGLPKAGATPAGVPEVSLERDVRASSDGSRVNWGKSATAREDKCATSTLG